MLATFFFQNFQRMHKLWQLKSSIDKTNSSKVKTNCVKQNQKTLLYLIFYNLQCMCSIVYLHCKALLCPHVQRSLGVSCVIMNHTFDLCHDHFKSFVFHRLQKAHICGSRRSDLSRYSVYMHLYIPDSYCDQFTLNSNLAYLTKC